MPAAEYHHPIAHFGVIITTLPLCCDQLQWIHIAMFPTDPKL